MPPRVRGYVANTDFDWFSFLRERKPEEANFWQPSGRAFRVLQPGEPLFFRLKSPHNAIGGSGLLRFEVSGRLREEWENGKVYYDLQGHEVAVPRARRDRPSPEALRWHNEHVFEKGIAA